MISPQLAAGLTLLLGLCLLAGWLSAFRNRSYLGWLGFAFLSFSGSLTAGIKLKTAGILGPGNLLLIWMRSALFVICLIAFALAVITAVQETTRRIREIKTSYQAAEEALLEMIKASREREARQKGEDSNDESSSSQNER